MYWNWPIRKNCNWVNFFIFVSKSFWEYKKDLAVKAAWSAGVGLPISWTINVLVLPLLNGLIHENVFLAGALLALPFILASWIRIYIIDLIYNKYQVGVLEIVKRMIRIWIQINASLVKKSMIPLFLFAVLDAVN